MTDYNHKLDKILDNMTDIKVSLAKHEVLHEQTKEALNQHVIREEQILSKIEDLEKVDQLLYKDFHKEIEPFKRKIAMFRGAIWILGVASGILYGLYQVLAVLLKFK